MRRRTRVVADDPVDLLPAGHVAAVMLQHFGFDRYDEFHATWVELSEGPGWDEQVRGWVRENVAPWKVRDAYNEWARG